MEISISFSCKLGKNSIRRRRRLQLRARIIVRARARTYARTRNVLHDASRYTCIVRDTRGRRDGHATVKNSIGKKRPDAPRGVA